MSSQGQPLLSVVIPTRDRREILERTLEALDRQEGLQGRFEVIVADDGSSDGTAEWLRTQRGRRSYRLRWLILEAAGPAVARNRAIAEASGSRILLLGDDTVPLPGTLVRHGPAGQDGVGVQGHIDWDPQLTLTPVMRFLAPAGPQFYFRGLRPGEVVPYTAVLGSNLSAPTEWFHREPFDEAFPAAAFEDTELAYRWYRRGYRVVYRPDALCHHHHAYSSIGPFLRRQRRAGRAARHALRRHPRLAWRIAVLPAVVGLLRVGAYVGRSVLGRASAAELWDLQCRRAFFAGMLAP